MIKAERRYDLAYALAFCSAERAQWCAEHEALDAIGRSEEGEERVLVGTVPFKEGGARQCALSKEAQRLATIYGGRVVVLAF